MITYYEQVENLLKDSNSDLSEKQILRLRNVLKDTSLSFLHKLAEKYGVEIPFDTPGIYEIAVVLVNNLSLKAKKELLSEYGDAGKISTYLYITENKTPPIKDVFQKAQALTRIEHELPFQENFPYCDEAELDYPSKTIRIRFHYLRGLIFTLDKNGEQREHRLYHSGVVIYRPECKILEVRIKAGHKSVADKMRVRVPVALGLEPFISLNLMDEKLIGTFVVWISSLNSATIELPISDVAGSLRITAKRGLDLRTAERYTRELKQGRLRGAHVTIDRGEDHRTNFRIYFRNCHLTYTLFTREKDIGYVVDAIEKVVEGYKFVKPYRLLEDYFEKKD